MIADRSSRERPVGHVALATDRAYLPWCATAIVSCIRATPERFLVIHLVHHGDLTLHDQQRMREMVREVGAEIDFLQVADRRLADLPPAVKAHGGAISCARMLLPELMPQVDRLVYLDADTLTVTSIDALWSTPLEGVAMAAVPNVVEPRMRPRLIELGLPDHRRYLNSGVLVMNLKFMREHDSGDAVLRYIHAAGDQLLWVDQDALNATFQGNWHVLHPRWNVQNSLWGWPEWAEDVFGAAALADAKRDPAVIHFEGPSFAKPWHYLCQHPYVDSYRRTLAATPWHGAAIEDRTLVTRAIRWLPPSWRIPAYLGLLRLRARRG